MWKCKDAHTKRELTKRELILAAALEVFAEKGFHNAKIKEIAQQAEVGKGTVYEYFKSKQELFQQALLEGMKEFDGEVAKELAACNTAREKLERLIEETIRIGGSIFHFARIAAAEIRMDDKLFHGWVREIHEVRLGFIKDIIDEGIAKGEFKKVDSLLAAKIFYGGVATLLTPFVSIKEGQDCQDVAPDKFVDIYLEGILLR